MKKKSLKIILLFIEILIVLAAILLIKKSISKPEWKITQYSDDSGSQAMFYTITSDENDLIIVDGGYTTNAEKVKDVIREYGNHVEAWILTHPHPDHIGAFNEVYAQSEEIVIEQIYDNGLDYEYYDTLDQSWDDIGTYSTYLNLIQGDNRVKHIMRNAQFEINNLKFEVMNSYDETSKGYSEDIGNDGSLVFKVSDGKQSMLFTGDCHSESVSEYLIQEYGERLKSDYVQMGHHGNNSLPKEFYEYVNPSTAFFDAPEWLVNGEQYTTKETEAYMTEMGAKVLDYRTAPNTIELKQHR